MPVAVPVASLTPCRACGSPRPPFVLLLLLAAACGGDADAGPAPGDYFAQLQRVSETAHIQERGLRRDLRVRLEEATLGEDRRTVVTVFLDQSARLYQDVIDALGALDPPAEIAAAQQAFSRRLEVQLDLIVKVRDAGFPTADEVLEQLEATVFRNAAAETRPRATTSRRPSRRRAPTWTSCATAACRDGRPHQPARRALAILSELSPMGRWRGAGPHRLAA